MASEEGLLGELQRWQAGQPKTMRVEVLSFEHDPASSPPLQLRVRLRGHTFLLFGEGLQEDGRADYFIEDESANEENVEADDSELAESLGDLNSSFADRRVGLTEALTALLQAFPLTNPPPAAPRAQGDETSTDVIEFESWCLIHGVPGKSELLRQRYFSQGHDDKWSGTAAMIELRAAQQLLEDRDIRWASCTCEAGLGYLQMTVDLCEVAGLDEAICEQLGLGWPAASVKMSLVLQESKVKWRTDWLHSLALGKPHELGFFQALQQDHGEARYSPTLLFLELFNVFVAAETGTVTDGSKHGSIAWLNEARTLNELVGNIFFDFSQILVSFLKIAPKYCPICLEPHADVQTHMMRGKLLPCEKELCTFRFEEFFVSVRGELMRDPSVVGVHLMFTAAACSQAETFEPFPPHFLRVREVRHRAGELSNPATASASGPDLNKDVQLIENIMSKLPTVDAMVMSKTEEELRQLLSSSCKDLADPSLAYKLVRFCLGSNRLVLERLSETTGKLKSVPSGALQLVVVSNAPSQESAFQARRILYGSEFAFHGSPLQKWYSILRNGLLNMSRTKFMTAGAVYGEGVYLAEDARTALGYCGGFRGTAYRARQEDEGRYAAVQVLGIVEYIKDRTATRHSSGIVTVTDPKAVQLKFLIILPASMADEETMQDMARNPRRKLMHPPLAGGLSEQEAASAAALPDSMQAVPAWPSTPPISDAGDASAPIPTMDSMVKLWRRGDLTQVGIPQVHFPTSRGWSVNVQELDIEDCLVKLGQKTVQDQPRRLNEKEGCQCS